MNKYVLFVFIVLLVIIISLWVFGTSLFCQTQFRYTGSGEKDVDDAKNIVARIQEQLAEVDSINKQLNLISSDTEYYKKLRNEIKTTTEMLSKYKDHVSAFADYLDNENDLMEKFRKSKPIIENDLINSQSKIDMWKTLLTLDKGFTDQLKHIKYWPTGENINTLIIELYTLYFKNKLNKSNIDRISMKVSSLVRNNTLSLETKHSLLDRSEQIRKYAQGLRSNLVELREYNETVDYWVNMMDVMVVNKLDKTDEYIHHRKRYYNDVLDAIYKALRDLKMVMASVETLHSKLQTINAQKKEAEAETTMLKSKLNSNEKDIADLTRQNIKLMSDKSKEMHKYKLDLDNSDAKYKDCQSELENCNKSLHDMTNKYNELRVKTANDLKSCEELTTLFEKQSLEVQKLRTREQQLQKLINVEDSLIDRIRRILIDEANVKKELSIVRENLKKSQDTLNDMQNKWELTHVKSVKLEDLQIEFDKLSANYQKINDKLKERNEEVDKLTSEIKNLASDLSDCNEEVDRLKKLLSEPVQHDIAYAIRLENALNNIITSGKIIDDDDYVRYATRVKNAMTKRRINGVPVNVFDNVIRKFIVNYNTINSNDVKLNDPTGSSEDQLLNEIERIIAKYRDNDLPIPAEADVNKRKDRLPGYVESLLKRKPVCLKIFKLSDIYSVPLK